MTKFEVEATDPVWGAPIGKITLFTHDEDKCAGEACVIHAPSNHHMRDWPLLWRADRRMMERTCPHGIGHPDPDSVTFHHHTLGQQGWGTHGCDGCCANTTERE
jgi:hypothetical protein